MKARGRRIAIAAGALAACVIAGAGVVLCTCPFPLTCDIRLLRGNSRMQGDDFEEWLTGI